MTTDTHPQYTNTPVDIKLRLSALWIAMMFVFAYVDIFGLMRPEFLESLLHDGSIPNTPFTVTQGFLVFALSYVLPACLMVYLSLVLSPVVSRRVNIGAAALYVITIVGGCVGEDQIFYLIGSAVEVVLLAIIIRTAYRWPLVQTQTGLAETAEGSVASSATSDPRTLVESTR